MSFLLKDEMNDLKRKIKPKGLYQGLSVKSKPEGVRKEERNVRQSHLRVWNFAGL